MKFGEDKNNLYIYKLQFVNKKMNNTIVWKIMKKYVCQSIVYLINL